MVSMGILRFTKRDYWNKLTTGINCFGIIKLKFKSINLFNALLILFDNLTKYFIGSFYINQNFSSYSHIIE